MKIYHYNKQDGLYVGEGLADLDPMDDSNWLIPAFATTSEPLPNIDGKAVRFIGGAWEYSDVPPSEQQYTYAELRVKEYPPIGDQVDALWKGGAAAAEMLATVQAVKTKYPKPESQA